MRVSFLMKQQQYWSLFIALDVKEDTAYNYHYSYLQQHVLYLWVIGVRPVLISIDHRSGAALDNRTGGGMFPISSTLHLRLPCTFEMQLFDKIKTQSMGACKNLHSLSGRVLGGGRLSLKFFSSSQNTKRDIHF